MKTNREKMIEAKKLYHYDDAISRDDFDIVEGMNENMEVSLCDDEYELYGDCTDLYCDCTDLKGDCTGVEGDASCITLDFDKCNITKEEREKGIDIDVLYNR